MDVVLRFRIPPLQPVAVSLSLSMSVSPSVSFAGTAFERLVLSWPSKKYLEPNLDEVGRDLSGICSLSARVRPKSAAVCSNSVTVWSTLPRIRSELGRNRTTMIPFGRAWVNMFSMLQGLLESGCARTGHRQLVPDIPDPAARLHVHNRLRSASHAARQNLQLYPPVLVVISSEGQGLLDVGQPALRPRDPLGEAMGGSLPSSRATPTKRVREVSPIGVTDAAKCIGIQKPMPMFE